MQTIYPATTLDVSITYPSTDFPIPTYTTGTAQEATDGWAFFTSNVTLTMPNWSNGSGRPAILVCHGGNLTGVDAIGQGGESSWGDYIRALVDGGFVVAACDQGKRNSGNNLSLRALDLLYAYVTGITGGTKVGLMGSSGGGLAALGWARLRPDKVTGIFTVSPVLDQEAVRGSVWWDTPYSIQPGDPNEDLAANYDSGGDPGTSNGAFKVTTDAEFFVNAVDQGHAPNRYPSDWAGFNITIAHAHRDAGVPYQMSEWFVNEVNSPTVKFRPVTGATAAHVPWTLLTGGADDTATTANGGMPRRELVDFFHSVS